MQIIPINDTYNQTVTSLLGGQNCQFNIYQKNDSDLYCDVYVNNAAIITGVRCRNMVRIIRDTYLGFIGDLMFLDTQGTTTPPSTGIDPSSPGLGSRYLFCYLSDSDLNGAG